METTNTPTIYVACLSSYNAGHLYGTHIECNQSEDDIRAEIATMLADSPIMGAEEYEIHDTENLPSHIANSGIAAIAAWSEARSEAYDEDLFDAVHSYEQNVEYAADMLSRYIGHYESDEGFVHSHLEDSGMEVPTFVAINYEHTCREIVLANDYVQLDLMGGAFYLFSCSGS